MKKSKAWILWTLFKSMFVLSSCTFGGGFVIVSLMKKKFVEELQWLDEDEMLDVTAITQSAYDPLHGFQAAVDFLYSGRFHRLHHKNGHFLMIDRIAS